MNPTKNPWARAGLAIALGAVAACSNGSGDMMQGGKGAVQIVMSSSGTAPVAAATTGDSGSTTDPGLQSFNVTFGSILARTLDGQLIDVTIALPVTVDVLGLVSDGALTLPAGFLPPGTYDQLVIVITKVELTTANGTVITVDPPGGGWTAVIPVTDPFEVVEGVTTTVNIRFNADRSLRWVNGHWEFRPNIDCEGHHDGDDDEGDD